jgi:hypothetical protein
MNPYVRAAIDSETATLCRSSSGRRACATFRAAAALGNLVGAGELDRADTECLLLAAALQTGLPEREAIHHVRRGIRHGEKTPRSVPDPRPGERFDASTRHPFAIAPPNLITTEESPARPPNPEVEALWTASQPVISDPETVTWFARRYAERAASFLEHAELWDLVRAIPRNVRSPRWAWSCAGSWIQTGHRLLFRLWDHDGEGVSVRARCLDPLTVPKSLAPSGFSTKGMVLADPLGVQLLAGHVPEWWEQHEVVIAEGEPDWLLWAAEQRETNLQGPVVLGVESGAWSQRIADRIPDRARIALRVHHDPPGESYASQIAGSLHGRCQIFRSKVGKEGASK